MLAAIALGLGLSLVTGFVVVLIARAGGSSIAHPPPAVNLTADLLFDISFVGAAVYFARLHTRPRASDFGFRRSQPKTAIVTVLVAGIGFYVLTAIYASLLHLRGSDKLPSELGVSKSTVALVAAAVFVCVIAPIAEEFFFRGFVFGAFRRWRLRVGKRDIGTWLAAIVTGIFFGAVHASSASAQYLIPLGFLGFVLCLVRWWTRSLYPCMALHCFNNALALGVNTLHWKAIEILALIAASILVIAVITGPLATRQDEGSPAGLPSESRG